LDLGERLASSVAADDPVAAVRQPGTPADSQERLGASLVLVLVRRRDAMTVSAVTGASDRHSCLSPGDARSNC
jgi:hypothetical protein